MYTIKLHEFEGPLDLLLFFIKRDELDIYNIPISRITKEFLDYVHYMEVLDLEIAGEFLVMAAELMQIKVRMLLPPEPGEEEEQDPRANLIKRLVEYKRFKEVAVGMSVQEDAQRKVHYRGYYEADPRVTTEEEEDQSLRDVSLFDLISSFKFAIERMPKKFVHEIVRLNVTLEEQIDYILDFFSRRSEATFYELVKDMVEKIRVVVTFIALLEMIRSKQIVVRQAEAFGEVSIMRNVV
ncbi:segregation/condensation protein A [bacterium]|jgi:segregation and condensation protein A|nr:MAG: segregation/condensation protein A [bacterium]